MWNCEKIIAFKKLLIKHLLDHISSFANKRCIMQDAMRAHTGIRYLRREMLLMASDENVSVSPLFYIIIRVSGRIFKGMGERNSWISLSLEKKGKTSYLIHRSSEWISISVQNFKTSEKEIQRQLLTINDYSGLFTFTTDLFYIDRFVDNSMIRKSINIWRITHVNNISHCKANPLSVGGPKEKEREREEFHILSKYVNNVNSLMNQTTWMETKKSALDSDGDGISIFGSNQYNARQLNDSSTERFNLFMYKYCALCLVHMIENLRVWKAWHYFTKKDKKNTPEW